MSTVEADRIFESEIKFYAIECMDCNEQGNLYSGFMQAHKEKWPTHKSYILGHVDEMQEGQEMRIC